MSKVALQVEACDLLKSTNGPSHHTDEYETIPTRLVVRRGQSFLLRLTLNRDTDFPTDLIRFEFHIGGRPMSTQKSRIYLNLIDPKAGDNNVGVRYSTLNTGKIMDLEIFTPSDMGAGQWKLMMYSSQKRGRSSARSLVSDNIVMLFNAWNKNDDVYMENEKWRQEYIMNDEGRLYFGSEYRIGGMDWYFGQFEKEVLDAALKLIKMERLLYRDRGDAVLVSRHLSALVNDNDDDGVLVGNWSDDFGGGKSPVEWIGSYAILKKFVEDDKPVKYGQCWVFSGVLCAVLRTLGIPARSVTNFESAHDTDANLTIDYHYDEKGKRLENDDSIWNFHVWNDVWMARPDLPKGYGGWQALDATPQEESSGKFRCGPMPVSAIKQGLINMDYDGPFIYAEVNGTKRHWRRTRKFSDSSKDEYEELMSESAAIGKYISTKHVGNDSREDVTNLYKYKEGTPEEALSFKTARKYVTFTKSEKKEVKEVIKIEHKIPGVVPVGKDITATFKFTNVSETTQEVFLGVVGKVMQYNGSVVSTIHEIDFREKIAPSKTKTVSTTIAAKTYLAKVKNNNDIKFFALGGVEGTGARQTFAHHASVQLEKPKIEVMASSKSLRLGDSTTLNISFRNPLSIALLPGKLRVEGSGFTGVVELAVNSIKAHSTFKKSFTVTPRRVGNRKVIFGYSSPTLSGLQGSVMLTVTAPK